MRLILPVLAVFILVCLPVSAGEKDQIDVTAKLVDIPGKFPPDDLYDYAYIMKYEVQGGKLDKQTILVAHYKPRRPRKKIKDKMKKYIGGKLKKFKVGAVHKMTLDPKLDEIWQDAVIDEYFATDKKSTRYWCLKVDSK
ncbi:MAG: hypothetical protein JRJ19_01675 [Deltaproteobacteria bacterium]|nr:hypothetical protein [Deltaproteobacteria bacterium]MBW1870742.1 hypothetical protein [Deltaproteobacteria bacterium]